MSGLLAGILLSRTVGGPVAGAFGWRVVYVGSAVPLAVLRRRRLNRPCRRRR